jgi:hypothetical protein
MITDNHTRPIEGGEFGQAADLYLQSYPFQQLQDLEAAFRPLFAVIPACLGQPARLKNNADKMTVKVERRPDFRDSGRTFSRHCRRIR